MSTTQDHTRLVAAIRLAVGREPDFTLWLNSKGKEVAGRFRSLPGLVVGASDLVGILAPAGRFIALEVKTGQARMTAQQRQFQELIKRRGGFACVVRSVDDAIAALARARGGAAA